MRWPFLGISCLLALAACGGSSGSHIIAWKPLPPPKQPSPPLASPCRASDLRAAGPGEWNGAGGDLAGDVGVTNTSNRPCSLIGEPRIRFSGPVPTRVTVIPAYGDDPLNRPPLSSLRALAPGKSARLMVLWRQSWCNEPPPKVLILTLPGSGSTLRIPNSFAPRCDDPIVATTETLLGVSRWTPSPQRMAPHLPLRAELIGPTYRQGEGREVRYHVQPGHVLEYEVALVNTSKKPFHFQRCPLYSEGVTRDFVFVLNCRPVGTIPPGGRAVFQMRIPTPLRTCGVSWYLPQVDGDTFVDAVVIVGRVSQPPPPTRP